MMRRMWIALGAVAALSACTQTAPQPEIDMMGDALPSAEVTAFQAADARLGYRGARIEYDARNCAMYQATGPDGRTYRELLRAPDNSTICRP